MTTTGETMRDVTRYVLGFAFTPDASRVVLIHKHPRRGPEYVRDRLNGIGGKIDDGETPLAAMRREGAEEAGLSRYTDWQWFHEFGESDWRVYCFRAFTAEATGAVPLEDEPVDLYPVAALPPHIVPNLAELIPRALSAATAEHHE